MELLIAIPALNEEESIDSIIQRSLDARVFICANSPVTRVSITVVSDGSTDRTVERAARYTDEIELIVFPKNRGYGAAIKEAWNRSHADMLGFLDADGTCDPRFFATLCETAAREPADVVLGCRLNRDSRMPPIRRIGNFLFAAILSIFSSSRVRDTASGMRVVRRSSLDRLYPLPDGLHFTPAMSARAMLSEATRIVEVDMPYREREGESKLRIGKDGLRFLRVILEAAFLYRPSRPLGLIAIAGALAAVALIWSPAVFYLQNRSVAEWMIYRFVVSDLAGIACCVALGASFLTGRMSTIALEEGAGYRSRRWSARFFESHWFWFAPLLLVLAGVLLVWSSIVERLTTGGTHQHWSRYMVMLFCFAAAIILSVARLTGYVVDLIESRVRYLKNRGALAAAEELQAEARVRTVV